MAPWAGAARAGSPVRSAPCAPAWTGPAAAAAPPLLAIRGLDVCYGRTPALRGVDLALQPGEAVGLLGPSGCGKSTLARAVLGLLPPGGSVTAGAIAVRGRDLATLRRREWRQLRGAVVALAHQEPSQALNPVRRIGEQIAAVLAAHGWARRPARARAAALLAELGLGAGERFARAYPHQLSGGQLQRAALAQALACGPALLIADEPTTGLDAETRAAILSALRRRVEQGMALLLISHEPAVLAAVVARTVALPAPSAAAAGEVPATKSREAAAAGSEGEGVPPRRDKAPERNPAPGSPEPSAVAGWNEAMRRLSPRPLSGREQSPGPPTRTPERGESQAGRGGGSEGERAYPDVRKEPERSPNEAMRRLSPRPLLKAAGLTKTYTRAGRRVPALEDVNLTLSRGETVVVMGPSGAGKSTLARCLAGLEPADGGTLWRAPEVGPLGVQMIWQDPASALNPRLHVGELVAEPWRIAGGVPRRERERRAAKLLEQVSLPGAWLRRRPAELSGGEKRRVGIARALALAPAVLILDEALASVEPELREDLLGLLAALQARRGLAYVFITHDAELARRVGGRRLLLAAGRMEADACPAS